MLKGFAYIYTDGGSDAEVKVGPAIPRASDE